MTPGVVTDDNGPCRSGPCEVKRSMTPHLRIAIADGLLKIESINNKILINMAVKVNET